MKIVFMGTPVFARKTFEGILESGEDVILTVTQPDKPKGRGLQPSPSSVKQLSVERDIPVMTPAKIGSRQIREKLTELAPDLIIVSAYGKIIPKRILEIPNLYPINVHASLLPKYRGAAPINWAIIRGETKTGITIIKMNEKMDAGDIMMSEEVLIDPQDNASSLHDKLARLGSQMIKRAIAVIKSGNATFTAQNEDEATFAPMLKKQDGLIDWKKSNIKIENFIRGMNPWPGAHTFLNGHLIKIFRATSSEDFENATSSEPGKIVGLFKDSIMVKAGRGSVLVHELQMASRKRLTAGDFIKGYGDIKGKLFGNG